jgi:capsular exopolysaccharide synthesis family protein
METSNSAWDSVRPRTGGQRWTAVARFDVLSLSQLCRRRWRWLAGGVLLGACLGIVHYSMAPVRYESTAQILLMRKDSKLAAKGVEGSNETESRVSEDLLATHMQVIQSPQIVGTAVKKHGYDRLPSIVERLTKDENAVDFIIERLLVTRGGKGQAKTAHVLNVGFAHTSDLETQFILEAIVASYQEFLAEKFQDVSREAADLITKAKVDLAHDLRLAEEEYRVFREKAPLLWKGDESSNIHRVHYEELQASLSEMRLLAAGARARLEVVQQAILDQDARHASDTERLALLDAKHIERLELLVQVDRGDSTSAQFQADQPLRLEAARAEHESLLAMLIRERSLCADLGPKHPQVQDVRRQMEAAKEFLQFQAHQIEGVDKKHKLTPEILVHAYLELLRQDLVTLEKNEQGLEAAANREHEAAKALVGFELKGETLRKEVARKQDLYEAVLDRLREINLVKEYGGYITEVIAPVERGEKVSPKLSMSLVLGLFLGVALGMAGGFTGELRDRSFHDIDELRSDIELPLLTMVPKLPLTSDAQPPMEHGWDRSLQTHYLPKSLEAESFRGLRTSLFFAAASQRQKVIAFTSPKMGDGKSTIVANLAISIANSGRRVLLMDGDLRRPRQHMLFAIDGANGLTDALLGKCAPVDCIHATPLTHLFLLPAGKSVANPSELLSDPRFAELLNSFRDDYDFILLDCPPVLAVADPCIVASHVDGVVLTVKLPDNTRPQVNRAKEMLDAVRAHMIGIVVNGCEMGHGASYSRYAYGYGYGGYKNRGYNAYTETATPSLN